VTVKRRNRPYKQRPGRASPYDEPNVIIGSTNAMWKVGHVFSTLEDIDALQSASFPATELRRRKAAEQYYKLHRTKLLKGRKADAAMSEVAMLYHIDPESFINWMKRAR
jgi:hypothetical protein